jgi:hypothetical protein
MDRTLNSTFVEYVGEQTYHRRSNAASDALPAGDARSPIQAGARTPARMVILK